MRKSSRMIRLNLWSYVLRLTLIVVLDLLSHFVLLFLKLNHLLFMVRCRFNPLMRNWLINFFIVRWRYFSIKRFLLNLIFSWFRLFFRNLWRFTRSDRCFNLLLFLLFNIIFLLDYRTLWWILLLFLSLDFFLLYFLWFFLLFIFAVIFLNLWIFRNSKIILDQIILNFNFLWCSHILSPGWFYWNIWYACICLDFLSCSFRSCASFRSFSRRSYSRIRFNGTEIACFVFIKIVSCITIVNKFNDTFSKKGNMRIVP